MKPKIYFAVVVKDAGFINKFNPIRRVPALFETKKAADNYVAEIAINAPAFPGLVRVERVGVINA